MEEWRAQRTRPYSSMRLRGANANVLSSTLLRLALEALLKGIVEAVCSQCCDAFV